MIYDLRGSFLIFAVLTINRHSKKAIRRDFKSSPVDLYSTYIYLINTQIKYKTLRWVCVVLCERFITVKNGEIVPFHFIQNDNLCVVLLNYSIDQIKGKVSWDFFYIFNGKMGKI